MDAIFYVCLAVAVIIGIVIGWLVFGKKKDSNNVVDQEKVSQAEILQQQLDDSEAQVQVLKHRYENLLAEAKEQTRALEEKLKDVLANGTDEAVKQQLAEVETLKKKIKDLQEENEEFEEDLESLKKKLKNKESDNFKLQDDLDSSLREKKKLQEELITVSDELREKTHELDTKVESLLFVQEILTARRTTDESINNLYAKIDNLSDFIRGELKDAISGIYSLNDDLYDELYGSGLDSWSVTAKKSWIQGKTSIAFVGEFSAGKTSIVNRILSQDDPNVPLLPVSTKATTAIPTYISGGVGTRYEFVTPNNELKKISEDTFKRVNKEVLDQVKGVSSLIQYFVMTYKNPHLDRLSILDTPGFNSNDKEDSERTIGVINECDALFWVFDVNAGTVNRTSINLIKEHLKKPLYVVINKVDTKAETEVNSVEQLIRKTLGDSGLSVQGFIRFSAKAPLDEIMRPISSVPHNNERENYLTTLSELVGKWTEEQEKDVVNAKKVEDELLKKSNNLVDKYNYSISSLNDHCVDVSNIPHFEEHLFRKDNYEMSQQEFNRMINLLKIICEQDCNALCNLYNAQMETRGELQEAFSRHAEERQQWQRLNQCKEILMKKIKELI